MPPSTAAAKHGARSGSSSTTTSNTARILGFLLAFRLANALCLQTFFQPDEFFQSLEPAWQLAFGPRSGAWITWEWHHHLRSSLHPYIFAAVYQAADWLAQAWMWAWARYTGHQDLPFLARADVFIAAPKIAQAVFAAVGDFFTWRFAQQVYYGPRAQETTVTLALVVLSPWQWLCSTRTLSNCLETTLTIAALCYWPWRWPSESGEPEARTRTPSPVDADAGSASLGHLRVSLVLAATACILRPTNLIIWLCLAAFKLIRFPSSTGKSFHYSSKMSRGTRREQGIFLREVILAGSLVCAFSALLDYTYYGRLTFPPLNFLYFNIAQSLAVFYGTNDWHYYLSQGLPMLLLNTLPFAVVGLGKTLLWTPTGVAVRQQIAWVCVLMLGALSLISHKEARFIYPLFPLLTVVSAAPVTAVFYDHTTTTTAPQTSTDTATRPRLRLRLRRKKTLTSLLAVNICLAYYVSIVHASGYHHVFRYLREQYSYNTKEPEDHSHSGAISVGFLMPCHSTPWRSHLVSPDIHAWALSCDPPVGLSAPQKAAYVDEADQFYADPRAFLKRNLTTSTTSTTAATAFDGNTTTHAAHEWPPDYLVFFQQLEPLLQDVLSESAYRECYRVFNTAWHDDPRRRGDMVVWCLDEAGKKK